MTRKQYANFLFRAAELRHLGHTVVTVVVMSPWLLMTPATSVTALM